MEPEDFIIELPLNYTQRPAPKLTQAELAMINTLPGYMSDQILEGIVELDPNNEDDMLPAFFAYRMRRIPGIFGPNYNPF